jgi:hypothetical protein
MPMNIGPFGVISGGIGFVVNTNLKTGTMAMAQPAWRTFFVSVIEDPSFGRSVVEGLWWVPQGSRTAVALCRMATH